MPAKYPNAVATTTDLPVTRVDITPQLTSHMSDHNKLAMEVMAIETELGLNPRGNFSTVKDRLDRSEWLPFSRSGDLEVAVGKSRFYFPYAATILSVMTMVGTTPSGAALIVDVNKNGSTLFVTQADRPSIAAGTYVSSAAIPTTTAIGAGDYLTVDVDQVGSTVPGSDLIAIVQFRR